MEGRDGLLRQNGCQLLHDLALCLANLDALLRVLLRKNSLLFISTPLQLLVVLVPEVLLEQLV